MSVASATLKEKMQKIAKKTAQNAKPCGQIILRHLFRAFLPKPQVT
jgi:hypothetical protein